MKKLSTILKPTVLKEDAENACEDAMSCLNEIITMSQNLMEGLQDVSEDLDENMMNCISETRDKIKDACECAKEAYGFDACCETCKDDEESEVEEENNITEAVSIGDWSKGYIDKYTLRSYDPKTEILTLTWRHYKDWPKQVKMSKELWLKLTMKSQNFERDFNKLRKNNALEWIDHIHNEDAGISKDDETKFHKKLDDLVHSTFGKRMDETTESATLSSLGFKKIGLVKLSASEIKNAYYKWASKIPPGFIGWEQPRGKYAVGLGADGRFFIVNKRKPSEIDFYSGEKDVLNALRNLNLEESALSEAKTIDAPEEKGLNDYVMPKSVIKMIAKQQFSQVKTKSKLFDTVATLDKTKDLLHLFTSKKHKNILLGMFKIGKKASFFIHDTESSKANKLDNIGRYKDTKGFTDALSALFEKKKEDSVKKK